MTQQAVRSVVIAIPTYRRDELLGALIDVVRAHMEALAGRYATRLVLIDNDPDRSAETTAADRGVEYSHEPRPGIAAVRQKALDLGGDHDLVVMIDDDTVPEPGWLDALVRTWEDHRPAVVMGYVRYDWPPETDPWVVAGRFMRRTLHTTGTSLDHLATGNVLIDVGAVRSLGVSFDVSVGLSSGEDSLFGRDVLRAGGTIVACAESAVVDEVQIERTSVEFVRRRTIGHGETHVFVELDGLAGVSRVLARGRCWIGGAIRWVVFLTLHAVGRLTRDVGRDAIGRRRAWFAIGRMRAALGRRDAEYARDEA